MITRTEILKGQNIPSDLEPLLADYLERINKFRAIYGRPMIVNSGYRSREHNAKIGGAVSSAHCVCQAADFADAGEAMEKWIDDNPNVLIACGLYREHPEYTKGWVHLQSRPTKSGNYTFIP